MDKISSKVEELNSQQSTHSSSNSSLAKLQSGGVFQGIMFPLDSHELQTHKEGL